MASCFEGVSKEDILFCTINTSDADLDRLFTNVVSSGDTIFAHLRGDSVEVRLKKEEK